MLPKTYPVTSEVKETTFQMSDDEKQRMIAFYEEKVEMDRCAWSNEKFNDGQVVGRTIVAINLIRHNFSHEEIVQLTGLPLQEILRLSDEGLDKLSETCPVINEIGEFFIQWSDDEIKEEIALLREEMARRDWNALMQRKFEEGRATGLANVAINLIKHNISHEEIVQLTGLPIQEILRLSVEGLGKLLQMYPIVNDVNETGIQLSEDEIQRMIALSEEMAGIDRNTMAKKKFEDGRVVGRAIGLAEVALNLIRNNFSHEDIVRLTGLPLQEISHISKTIQ